MRLKPGMRLKDNGSIEYRFVIDGKRYSVCAKSVKELQQKEQELRTRIALGDAKNTDNIRFDMFFDKWINEKAKHVKTGTICKYKSMYKNYLSSLYPVKVSSMSRNDVMNVLNSAKTVSVYNDLYMLLAGVLKDAESQDILQKSPMRSLKMMKEKSNASNTIHRAFTQEEQKIIMGELKNEYLYELFALMLCTGIRGGEACALLWDDVDYKKNVIHINKTVALSEEGKRVVNSTKTEKSERDIPMNKAIRDILELQMRKTNSGNVFLSSWGNTLTTSSLTPALNRTVKHLNAKGHNIAPFGSHAFRDTFATRFIESGGSMQTLKTILGHSSLHMTMDLYAHVLPNTKQTEMDRLCISV